MAEINKVRISSCARGFRDMIGLSLTDLVGDITEVVKDAGYLYSEDSLGEKYSAFCTYLGEEQFAIVFNTDHYWNERFRRFTIAHEFGHINMPHHAAILRNTRQLQSITEFQSDDPLEREADLFAINFLVPREVFDKRAGYKDFNKRTIIDLANTFDVSILATCFRFIELTDLACSLIVSASNGKIKYEKRSTAFNSIVRHAYLKGYPVDQRTKTYDFINGQIMGDVDDCEVLLNHWYPNTYKKITCSESVIRLGYNDSYITMLSILDDIE